MEMKKCTLSYATHHFQIHVFHKTYDLGHIYNVLLMIAGP